MCRIDRRNIGRGAAVLAGLLVSGSTGSALAGGFGWRDRGAPAPTVQSVPSPQQAQVNLANRPILGRLMTPKQIYLGNYAGVYYPSNAPGSPLTPTTFRAMTGRPPRFGGNR